MPPNPDLMELVYASKLLAKTIDELDEKVTTSIDKLEDQQAAIGVLKDLIGTVDKKLELLPLVLAGKLEAPIEKRTGEAFEDLRLTLDELRNKLYAIKKQIKDQTGAHQLPSREQKEQWEKDKEKAEEDHFSVRKSGFRLDVPLGEGAAKVLKWIGLAILGIVGVGATGGGIWVLVDKLKHLLGGG